MIILAPYTILEPRTKVALERFTTHSLFFQQTPAEDEYAYWNVLKKWWNCGDDLMLVEQDIEISPTTEADFQDCSYPWCTFGYWLYGGTGHARWVDWAMGCVKYSASLQRELPIGEIEAYGRVKWNILDETIRDVLTQRVNITRHCHGEVAHHHQYNMDRDFLPSREEIRRYLNER